MKLPLGRETLDTRVVGYIGRRGGGGWFLYGYRGPRRGENPRMKKVGARWKWHAPGQRHKERR